MTRVGRIQSTSAQEAVGLPEEAAGADIIHDDVVAIHVVHGDLDGAGQHQAKPLQGEGDLVEKVSLFVGFDMGLKVGQGIVQRVRREPLKQGALQNHGVVQHGWVLRSSKGMPSIIKEVRCFCNGLLFAFYGISMGLSRLGGLLGGGSPGGVVLFP